MNSEDLCLVPSLDSINIQLQIGNEAQVQFSMPIGERVEVLKFDAENNLQPGKKIQSDAYLSRLDELCARHGNALNVRFFGFYSDVFDARVLEHLPHIQSLTVNCLQDASHLDAIGKLSHLKDLSLGVYNLEQKDILHHLPVEKLDSLTLEESKTKALDLEPLAQAKMLKKLRLFGHKKNIQSVQILNQLEEFVFNPARDKSLDFLNGLTGLLALKLVLGACENFNEVCLPNIRDLAVTRVRGLSTMGDLARFPKLERLSIEDQIQLKSIAFTAKMSRLKHISIGNCKSLEALIDLDCLPALTSLSAFQSPLSVENLKFPKSLSHAFIHRGSTKATQNEAAAIVARGLIAETHPDASFFYK